MMAKDGIPVRGNSTPLGWLIKDVILEGSYWPEPISVITSFQSSHGFVTVEAVGTQSQQHYTTTLPSSLWGAIHLNRPEYTFQAPAQPFRLALEAERLRLAYTADPLLAANNARVDLLPHQMEACAGYLTHPSSYE